MAPNDVLSLIFEGVDVFNAQAPTQHQLEKRPDTIIVGQGGTLDSLSVINFLVLLEEHLGERLGRRVRILDETLLAQPDGPLHELSAIAQLVANQS